ncbi:MAG: hypothetical protein ACE5JZ_09425 [Kiloniellales bacterium]
MRSLLGLVAVAVAALIGTTQSANAAYQMLALVASNQTVPLRCQGGHCAAEFSAFCLQPTRGSPPRGAPYRPVGGDGITLVATTTDGRTVEFDGGDHLQIVALRSHVAVRVSLAVEKLGALGARSVAVRVGANVSLVPEPIVGDPDPQTPWEIEVATGPLRRIGTRLVDNGRDTVIAARMTNDLINRLPERGRIESAARDSLWRDAAHGWAQQMVTDDARERARRAYERCHDTPLGQYFTMRQCLGSMHDHLMGKLNNAYWDAIRVGS